MFQTRLQATINRRTSAALIKQAVREAAQYAPPLYAAPCGPAPAHTRLTLRLRRPARLASSSCGLHEYS